jgi:hypothetical protein
MSITVDYFFNYPEGLAAITELMNKSMGCSLSPYKSDSQDMLSRFLGMELSLSSHGFENDMDLNFEEYSFYLRLRTPCGLALRGMQLSAMAYIAYVLYFGFKVTGMLVYDGQILLARYEERFYSEADEQRSMDSKFLVVMPVSQPTPVEHGRYRIT